MRIAVFSDLHVEHSNIKLDTSGADLVVLAGDIYALSQAKDGAVCVIDWIASEITHCPVIFVPGNHDFEASDMTRQWDYWKKVSQGTNVHCLWDEDFVMDDVRFLGTPLFTNFKSTNAQEFCMDWARSGVYDMTVTKVSGHPLTPEHYLEWFEASTKWLREELLKPTDKKNIVVSHFAPSKKMLNKKYPERLESAYWANDIDDLVSLSDAWISGHTHKSIVVNPPSKKNTKGQMISNARGVSKLFNVSADPNFARDFLFNTNTMMRLEKSPKAKALKSRI